ncbi:FKBP-type peptidyl-prolyl cis-trans isomerase [Actinotalea sp. K2]|uniref:FKBP-type peptidyl-prolyl cis-trans isomerase n=1 Tax=Actinotalea sp. K2 TaxID=2939438 RepID=UPI002017E293|nr:FKBP-type peptidyl-prolyl cis-trans isomerase [Actinotalea sp. K2]MCL3861045.1 FKBP-type peptidyl-prolyl cis-trans isomerase [Actinotalea sp. K2]
MRRPTTLTARTAAAVLAATLLLAGCAGGDDPAEPEPTGAEEPQNELPTATPEDIAALEAVTVEGPLGSAPEVTFDQPFAVSAPVARLVEAGDGEALEDGQRVEMHYVALSGDDGTTVGSTYETGPDSIVLGDPEIITALTDVLRGENVGARVLFAAPGGEATEATETSAATEAYPATVMAIEILSARTVPSRAEGEAVEPPAGLPEVTLADDGEPSIDIPADLEAPTELVVQPLIVGDGELVEAGQQATFQYSGWTFDGEQFDSSWVNGSPFTTVIGTGAVIPGWDEGIVGQPVGSQLLLIIPAELAYGGSESPLAEEDLIFVVDILEAS